jgi:hypothetical protein
MNNTLNNNSNKSSKAKEICTVYNPKDPISLLATKEVIIVPMLWIPPSIESILSSRNLEMFMAFLAVLTTNIVFPKNICSRKKAPKPPITYEIQSQH